MQAKSPALILRRLFLVAALACSAVMLSGGVSAWAANTVTIYFFYGEGCPHCEREKPFLEEMKRKYPVLQVRSYEVWHNQENAEFLMRLAGAYGFEASGVPVTFVGSTEPVSGFARSGVTARSIEDRIRHCLEKGCPDPAARLSAAQGTPESPPAALSQPLAQEDRTVLVPGMGALDASKMALPVLTIVLAGLDSFNPCAFFVLFTLLGILIHARTRGRMLLIGGIFVFFSGFIYFLFMAAWLNLFMHVGELQVVTVVAGLVAILIAIINIKDFFFFRKGISLTISEKAKPRLFERMRGLLRATSLLSIVTGTTVLAAVANAYELLCTAGFPMLFTRLLTLNRLAEWEYYLYLAFYNVVYVIPLAVIVALFTLTLGGRKLSEQQGRILKLVSGIMMLCLGVVLLIDPMMFHNIYTAVGLLLFSLGAAWAIVAMERRSQAGGAS